MTSKPLRPKTYIRVDGKNPVLLNPIAVHSDKPYGPAPRLRPTLEVQLLLLCLLYSLI